MVGIKALSLAFIMKLGAAFALWQDLYEATWVGLPAVLREIWADKSLLFHPVLLSHTFFMHVWLLAGESTDENGRPTKSALITPNA